MSTENNTDLKSLEKSYRAIKKKIWNKALSMNKDNCEKVADELTSLCREQTLLRDQLYAYHIANPLHPLSININDN